MFQVGVSLSPYIYAQAGSYKLPKLLKQGREAASYTTRWYRWIRWMMAEVPTQVVVVVSGCSNTVVIMFCHRHDKFEEELSILPWQRHVQTFPKEDRRRWGRHCCCCWQHSVLGLGGRLLLLLLLLLSISSGGGKSSFTLGSLLFKSNHLLSC